LYLKTKELLVKQEDPTMHYFEYETIVTVYQLREGNFYGRGCHFNYYNYDILVARKKAILDLCKIRNYFFEENFCETNKQTNGTFSVDCFLNVYTLRSEEKPLKELEDSFFHPDFCRIPTRKEEDNEVDGWDYLLRLGKLDFSLTREEEEELEKSFEERYGSDYETVSQTLVYKTRTLCESYI
jgi:hypothetical protein